MSPTGAILVGGYEGQNLLLLVSPTNIFLGNMK